MESILIYALLTSSAFYLGSRAVITRPLWSRYPQRLASFADCAACSGFWYGLGFGLLLRDSLSHPFVVLGIHPVFSALLIGLCSIVWTPIVAGLMQAGFERLGTAVADGETEAYDD